MAEEVMIDTPMVGVRPSEPLLKAVKPLDGYCLLLDYETGERKSFDVKPYIQGDFYGRLADEAYFKMARLEYDGWFVGWPEGQDLGPDDLYELSVPVV